MIAGFLTMLVLSVFALGFALSLKSDRQNPTKHHKQRAD